MPRVERILPSFAFSFSMVTAQVSASLLVKSLGSRLAGITQGNLE